LWRHDFRKPESHSFSPAEANNLDRSIGLH
jgi:hypothetical protein